MNTSPLMNEDYHYTLQAIELNKQSSSTNGADAIIRDVWISNFFQVMQQIEGLIDDYPYIAMVSHFIESHLKASLFTDTSHVADYAILDPNNKVFIIN